MTRRRLIAIMGTTASGKTDLAEQIADHLGARLLNADAFQIYRHMDIGTAKSPRKSEYDLMDIRDPSESFGVGEWVSMAAERLGEMDRDVVVVGGTGLYIRALFEGYADMASIPDPDFRGWLNSLTIEELLGMLPAIPDGLDIKNRVRVQRAVEKLHSDPIPAREIRHQKYKFSVNRDMSDTALRIQQRTREMAENGWPEEVSSLKTLGYSLDSPGMRAHGYRHIWRANEGTMKMSEAIDLTTMEVQRYAKRQRTWLRKEPGLIWLQPDDPLEEALRRMLN